MDPHQRGAEAGCLPPACRRAGCLPVSGPSTPGGEALGDLRYPERTHTAGAIGSRRRRRHAGLPRRRPRSAAAPGHHDRHRASLLPHPVANYSANSTYQANIRRLSATLPKNTSSSRTLFATATLDTLPDIIYALALCRGDTNASACSDCVATAFQDARQLCAFNKYATIFYDPCLRFSNQNFLNPTSGGSILILMNTQNVSAPAKVFDAAAEVLVNATADYAAANSSKRFGTEEEVFETFDKSNPKIYGLAQCTPDMAPADCRSCLGGIIAMMPKYFSGKQGSKITGLRCNYRYEQYSSGGPLLQLPAPSVGAPAPAQVNTTPPAAVGDIYHRSI